jgi:hypothetical protein
MPGMYLRFPVTLELQSPAAMRVPVTIAEPDVPHDLMRFATFAVVESDAEGDRPAGLAQRDLDWNLVFFLNPSRATSRTFYFYPSLEPPSSQLRADDDGIGNGVLSVTFAGKAVAKEIRLMHNGFATRGEQLGGVFNPSRELDASAKLLDHRQEAGPVMAQYRSRVQFGAEHDIYEFTFSVYAGSPMVAYEGRWLSPSDGMKPAPGDSFAAGTRVTGISGKSQVLPAAGATFGRAACIRPAGIGDVLLVLVAPHGNLVTPGSADRSLLLDMQQPAARYFLYDLSVPAAGDDRAIAATHDRAVGVEPKMSVGIVEHNIAPAQPHGGHHHH